RPRGHRPFCVQPVGDRLDPLAARVSLEDPPHDRSLGLDDHDARAFSLRDPLTAIAVRDAARRQPALDAAAQAAPRVLRDLPARLSVADATDPRAETAQLLAGGRLVTCAAVLLELV